MLRREWFIPVLLVSPFTALADDMIPEGQFVPPAYKSLRFDENYSRLFWEATAFLTRPVEDIGGISGSDSATTFWGLYVTHWLDAPRKLGVDLYYLGIANEHGEYASGTGNEHRHTFGTRLFGTHNHWDWNGEAAIQVGTFGNESILAWTASLDSGYTWDTQWQPRLGLKVDVASGDTNPNDVQQGT